ncbi:MAG: GEVED domain-containing protein [Spirosomataceae bacterium]
MKQLLNFLLCFSLFLQLSAQESKTCGFNSINIKDFKEIRKSNSIDSSIIIRIPVVFHVYHHGEQVGYQWNFHEDTLRKAIYKLNELYRGKNKYFETYDSKIEFFLLSDSLNCSQSTIPANGVKRANLTQLSPYLYQLYLQEGLNPANKGLFEKELNQLSSNPVNFRCLNIRLIPFVNEIAGFVSTGELETVILDSGIIQGASSGDIGGFAHEIGHVFGLSHTFYGGYTENNCLDGDGLTDTDVHKGSDWFYPDDLNTCTGKKKGKIIYNIMSYGLSRNNFSKMQINLMRETIAAYYPEIINPNTLTNPKIIGTPISACSFSKVSNINNFDNGLEFNLNALSFKNQFEKKVSYSDYSCSVKGEFVIGQVASFNLKDNNNFTTYYKIYIDYNNDGDFGDTNEEVVSGVKNNQNLVAGSFTIYSGASINTWLRLRIIRSTDSMFTSCSTQGDGSAFDFKIIILSNCTKPHKPLVSNQNINYGQNALLSSSGCTGQTNWYSKGNYLGSGVNFNTGILYDDSYFQATCLLNGCESDIQQAKVTVQQNLVISGTGVSNYCINGNINLNISSSLNSFYQKTLILRKGNTIISTKIISNNPTETIKIPINYRAYEGAQPQNIVYGSDYNLQIETQNLFSGKVIKSNVVNIAIGSISMYNHAIVENPNEIYNPNEFVYSDFLCSGKSKKLYAQVVDYNSSAITNQGLSFTWKRNGSIINTSTTNQITITNAGNYTFDVVQAGCTGTSNTKYVTTTNTISNNVNVIGTTYGCLDSNKELFSDYTSNTATYQWQKDGINILGANQSSFVANQSGNYNVLVQDAGCTIFKGKDKRISLSSTLPISIISSGGDTTLCFTNFMGFTYSNGINLQENTDGPANLIAISNAFSYQWQKDGLDLPEQNKRSINVNYHDIFNSGIGKYRLIKRQGSCVSYSNEINISETSIYPKPIIDKNATLEICSGSIPLRSKVSGYWYKDDVLASQQPFYYSATSSGSYKLVVGEYSTCRNESDPINISIGSTLTPKIKYYDESKQNLCGSGDYVGLMFDLDNSFVGFTYQWLKNGSDIVGANSSQYFTNIAGTYSLRVTNGSCVAISNEIIIGNNNNDIKLVVTDSNLGCANRATKLEVKGISQNSNSEAFVWKRNGSIIPLENFRWMYTDDAGSYTVEYNNGSGCNYISTPISLNKGGGVLTIQPITIAKGQSGNLTAIGCNDGQIKWYETNFSNPSISDGSNFITPGLDTQKSYFASCYYNGCENLVRKEGIVNISGCLENQVFTGYSLPNGIFRATNRISSSSIISSGTTYSSGKTVELLPGFKADINKVFKAEIGGCEN